MNLVTLAGHTIDESLLPKAPYVLDVGCRGRDFCEAIMKLRPKANLLGLDPGEEARIGPYAVLPFALVGDNRTEARYCEYSTGEGNFLTDLPEYYDATFRIVKCCNIATVLDMFGVDMLDVLKLDCEGSEYQIIQSLYKPVAKQISVEFHDSGYTPGFGIEDTDRASKRLNSLGYRAALHGVSKQGDGFGHWDSLFVLQP